MDRFVRQSNSSKWSGHSHDDSVMTLADMDLPLDPAMKKAIIAKLERTNNFTYKLKPKEYTDAIIQWYKQRHIKQQNIDIKPEYILDSPSVTTMIYISIKHFSKEGDKVLAFTPIWTQYQNVTEHLGRQFVQCKMYSSRDKNGFRYDINFTDFENKLKDCKIFILCNPQNPSGRCWNKKQVLKIEQICRKYDVTIVSDQILSDFVPDELRHKHYSFINSDYPKLVVGNSISKAFNFESLKGGYVIIRNKQMRQQYENVVELMSTRVNQFAAGCLEIAYSQDGKNWLKRSGDIIKQNYAYLKKQLKHTMAILSKYEGPYFIVINFQGYVKYIQRWFFAQKKQGGVPVKLIELFLKQHKIHGNLLPYFGLYQNVYTQMRFTIGVQFPFLKKFADRLRSALLQVEYQYRQLDAKL